VRQRQPATQVLRGFVRRLAVERHQGGGPAGPASDLRAPLAEADAGYFDAVLAAVDDFVKPMHVCSRRKSKRR